MTLEELRAAHPDVVAQIQAEARAEALTEARESAKAKARAEAATVERERILGIVGHAEAVGRREIAVRLAGMPAMTVETAVQLLADMPKALGPAEEFHALMQRLGPAPVDEQDEVSAYVARMKALDTAMLAEQAHARTAPVRDE